MNDSWVRVKKNHPCPICKKEDWCGVSEDGKLACCMRVDSSRMAKNGGHIHDLEHASLPQYVPPPRPYRQEPTIDFDGIYKAVKERPVSEARYNALAEVCGVHPGAIDAIGGFWSGKHKAWGFPMRSDSGKVIGIRLRSDSGKKWAVTGSKAGLFFDVDFNPPGKTVYVTEGPTDTIAAYGIGLWAIGRPSCIGQERMVKFLVKRLRAQYAVIISDNDEEKRTGYKYPGVHGAEKLAQEIDAKTKVVTLTHSDLRAAVRSGWTAENVRQLEENYRWT